MNRTKEICNSDNKICSYDHNDQPIHMTIYNINGFFKKPDACNATRAEFNIPHKSQVKIDNKNVYQQNVAVKEACLELSKLYLEHKIAVILHETEESETDYQENPHGITNDLSIEQHVLDSSHALCLMENINTDDESIKICRETSKYYIIKSASSSCLKSIYRENSTNSDIVGLFICCLENAENEAKKIEDTMNI